MEVHGSSKGKEVDKSQSAFSNATPNKVHPIRGYFYKIMVAPSSQTHKLRIPEKYVKTFYEEQFIKDYVNVKLGDGKIWKVELFKEESSGEVWLNKGWEKIVECYSIKYGHYLLFRYDENESQFHVNIFGMSGCEIDYDQVYYNHATTQQVLEISSEDEEMDKSDDHDNVAPDECLADEEKPTAIQTLEAFTSNKPHFKVVIQEGHLISERTRYPKLSIPMNYAKVHLTKKFRKELILEGPNDHKNSYNVILLYRMGKGAEIYGPGWRDFMVENELQRGDTCVFELINPRNNIHKVTIFRAARAC